MVEVAQTITLAGAALGAVGGALIALEFFQQPSYVDYNPEFDSYEVQINPQELTEHTWLGRAGGLLLSAGFTLLFVAELV
ncbi:MAG: hypothetical protein J07HB67_00370 [halophilic archaeon J07HB67]|jgi:hypothetical protein|nr:MAG: hypothetical protein J07HB67_00370 [halophilic archaeon J07HB67]